MDKTLIVWLGGVRFETKKDLNQITFNCAFHGLTKIGPAQKVTLDKMKNIRCASCGQHPHETNRAEIRDQL